MRKPVCIGLLVATAACGQSGNDSARSDGRGNLTTFDVQEAPATPESSSRSGPPSIAPTAAPGVAFNYRYAFRLPGDNIARVQEEHAQACEKMGVELCRITAMTYRGDGEGHVDAQLAFKLDPAKARGFGRDGLAAVTKAEGELLEAAITGTDVGSEIEAGERGQARQTDEIRRIEQQLARPGLSSSERVELQQQLQALKGSVRMGEAEQTGRRQQLASTPVVFDYQAGKTGGRLRRAIADAGDNFVSAATMVLIVLVTLLPWMVALLLLWLLWRWLRQRIPLLRRSAVTTAPAAISPEA
jgi:hypothetical protein